MTRQDIIAGTVAACAPIAHFFPPRDGEVGGGTRHHIANHGSDPMRDRSGADAASPEFAALEAARLMLREARATVSYHERVEAVPDADAWKSAEAALSKHVDSIEVKIINGQAAHWNIPAYAKAEHAWQQYK